jgi:hypothetical protein
VNDLGARPARIARSFRSRDTQSHEHLRTPQHDVVAAGLPALALHVGLLVRHGLAGGWLLYVSLDGGGGLDELRRM